MSRGAGHVDHGVDAPVQPDDVSAATAAVMERPILMSGPMVRAILEARPYTHITGAWLATWREPTGTSHMPTRCPYGVPGDTLWVREMHQIATGHMYDGEAAVRYAADGAIRAVTDERSNAAPRSRSLSGRWRPSIHMPRWASRLTLRVEAVRVQRVQDISGHDAMAEGIERAHVKLGESVESVRQRFASLWDSINGARAPWASNPWVWVVTFSRVSP